MDVRTVWVIVAAVYFQIDKGSPCNIRRCGLVNNILSLQFGPSGPQGAGAPQGPPPSQVQNTQHSKPLALVNNKGRPVVSANSNKWPYITIQFNHPIQSPVDIVTSKAVYMDLPTLTIGRPNLKGVPGLLKNTGHTVNIYINGSVRQKPYLTGGPLRDRFIFEQLHFHWGSTYLWGSEHFVDGESFSIEAHAVYFNQKYSNFGNAATKPDGLAVFTVFGKATGKINPLLEPIHKLLSDVTLAQSSVTLDSGEAMQWAASALSFNSEYFTYPGSLTTEPYSENVIFIVLPKPITLSYSQLQAFRGIKNESNITIRENKRQLQPLNRRPIVRSTNLT